MHSVLHACHVLLFLQLAASRQATEMKVPGATTLPAAASSNLFVRTRAGPVRGRRARDGAYSMFLGVPYATVDPTNPFGPAVPHFFEEVLDASDDSARCPQIEEFNNTITGTLDCLHLNIYVPTTSAKNPLPVMVYIFGGQFKLGFAGRYLYGPRFLVRHDIILVTLNYRLGAYGFMCLDIPEVPGNQGLKDQVLALRWIKQNIEAFGGDPSRITISGNSAGGISADLHSQFLKEHLFDRVILQSGVAENPDTIKESDPGAPFKLAKHLNYTAYDINDALSFLSGIPPHVLVAATNSSGLIFGPCVEKMQFNNDNYITKHPFHVKRKNVDVLIGLNNDEAYWAMFKKSNETFDRNDFVSIFMNNVFQLKSEHMHAELKDIVKHFYNGDGAYSAQNKRPAIDACSDFYFNHPTLRTVNKYLDSGVENIYLYMYSYSGNRNFIKHLKNLTCTKCGAVHADELGYLFDISYMEKILNAKDMLIVDRMTKLWTTFIKYGYVNLNSEYSAPKQKYRAFNQLVHSLKAVLKPLEMSCFFL